MIGDTIHAVASPPGSGARAVLRVSGPAALAAVATVFRPPPQRERGQVEGAIVCAGASLPALALVMPAPASYTGEDVVELHVPGSPLLCATLAAAMERAIGPLLRQARPGEFTARACLHGRLDFLQAEGVLLLIHGEDAAATAAGAAWVGGALTASVAAIRTALQDALAAVEVGLDFEAGETGTLDAAAWQRPLQRARQQFDALLGTLPAAARGGEVLLLGWSNAGKSSLCNALAGRDAVLVDDRPGTTRDLLRVELSDGVALWDAPGDLMDAGELDRQALQLRDRLGGRAAAALWVVDPAGDVVRPHASLPVLAIVCTKADARDAAAVAITAAAAAAQFASPPPWFATSARSGQGLAALRRFLAAHAGGGSRDVLQPLRAALLQAAEATRRAEAALPAAPELAGADLQQAVAALGELDGSHAPEAVLDRIYARFCLGK